VSVQGNKSADRSASLASSQDRNQLLADRGLNKDYRAYSGIKPTILRGDFDGDSREDVAVMVQEEASKKIGFIIMAANGSNYVVGAGHTFGNGGDDFTWMDDWEIHKKSESVRPGFGEGEPPKLKGDAIYAVKKESASCIIYYDGDDFKWYQQAD